MLSKAKNTKIPSYELIVVGLGLIGSSTLYEAAKMLNKNTSSPNAKLFSHTGRVLGIEQYAITHKSGSSHGESRITRLAIGEGPQYVSLAMRSQVKLRELQTKTNGKFGAICYEDNTGVLVLGSKKPDSKFHGTQGFLQTTRKIAEQFKIPHVNYDSKDELNKIFPQFVFQNDQGGYLEKTMGIINPEACVKAQIQLAIQEKAEVHTNEQVLNFTKQSNGKIHVKTSKGEYFTDKLILSAGPWMNDFLDPELKKQLTVYRQTVFYFEVDKNSYEFRIGKFPPFIWDLGNNTCVYGFPIMHNGKAALKIGTESYSQPTTAASVERKISDKEINDMYTKFIKPNFKGILPKCSEAFVCLYTMTSDMQFLIDYLPGFENKIIFASACSGHGAKHAAAIGEALAQQMILGHSDENILQFKSQVPKQTEAATLRARL